MRDDPGAVERQSRLGVQDSHSTSAMVLRPVTPTLPVEMHIALAYKAQPASELVPLFVDVVKEVVAAQVGPRARSA